MTDLPVQWFLPAETDEELALAGFAELEAQSHAALGEGGPSADEPEEMASWTGWTGWPALQDKLKDRFTKTGAFAEPSFKPPSPPAPPTLLEGGRDGAVVPPERDDAQTPAPRAKKPPKAASVDAAPASPEERHKRAVLALVGDNDRGAANSPSIDPIDEADLATCRAALKAVREAAYGVAVDDVRLSSWSPSTTAQTTVWCLDAPMILNRSAEVHDALAEFGLDVHPENEALVAYADGAGVLLVMSSDLDWTGVPSADAGGEE